MIKNMQRLILRLLTVLAISFTVQVTVPNTAKAHRCCATCSCCAPFIGTESNACTCISTNATGTVGDPSTTLGHITKEFDDHREWFVDTFIRSNSTGDTIGVIKALQLMTTELTAVNMQYVSVIGQYFDAKHQLETQRLFQTLTAKAHKDYQPSEGVCDFGSAMKSLTPSYERADTTRQAIVNRTIDRQMMAMSSLAQEGYESDKPNRLVDFIKYFCRASDNADNLGSLCAKSTNQPILHNRDIFYTQTVSRPLTLNLDYSNAITSTDERSLFALMNNLFDHDSLPKPTSNELLSDDNNSTTQSAIDALMDQRSLIAKRSVGLNSIASIAALKSNGNNLARPFLYSIIEQMGDSGTTADEIGMILGQNPSYHAQMEVLTKKIYQNPKFYTELIDKPANIARKEVMIQAAELMQKRDTYRSLLRSEAVIATMLETALSDEQEVVTNQLRSALRDQGR